MEEDREKMQQDLRSENAAAPGQQSVPGGDIRDVKPSGSAGDAQEGSAAGGPCAKVPVRPALLTVICVLTFIGSGWDVVSHIFSTFVFSSMDTSLVMEQFSSVQGSLPDGGAEGVLSAVMQSASDMGRALAEHGAAMNRANLVFSLLSLVGAVLMYRLRRCGFYIYTAAQLLLLLVLPYFAGLSMLVVLQLGWSLIFTVLFVVLYAVNLKHMR